VDKAVTTRDGRIALKIWIDPPQFVQRFEMIEKSMDRYKELGYFDNSIPDDKWTEVYKLYARRTRGFT